MPGALGEVCVEGSCDQRFLPPLSFLGFQRLLAPEHLGMWLEKETGQCFVATPVTHLGGEYSLAELNLLCPRVLVLLVVEACE